MDAYQAANAGQFEAQPQLDRRKLGADHEQEGIPRLASRHFSEQDAESFEVDLVFDVQLRHAEVLATLGVAVEVAATGDDFGVDFDADAVGRFEVQVCIGEAEVGGLAIFRRGQQGPNAHFIHVRCKRPQLQPARQRCIKHPALIALQFAEAQLKIGDEDRFSDFFIDWDDNFPAKPAFYIKAPAIGITNSQVESVLNAVFRQYFFEKTISVAGNQVEATVGKFQLNGSVLLLCI